MANSGDANAKVALLYVGNDGKFGSAPSNARAALNAVGATGNFRDNVGGGTKIIKNNQGINVPTF